MENASKALIIAGAVLVSIMIVGLGVVILNNVRGIINDANLDQEAAQANNEKFTAMFKENASASDVKNLITLIRNNNIIAENDRDGLGYIYITVDGTTLTPTQASKKIQNGKRYSINTPNDNSIKETDFIDNNNEWQAADRVKGAAYYYNGYIRAVNIETNSGAAPTPTTT